MLIPGGRSRYAISRPGIKFFYSPAVGPFAALDEDSILIPFEPPKVWFLEKRLISKTKESPIIGESTNDVSIFTASIFLMCVSM